jgi:hypothetical protein
MISKQGKNKTTITHAFEIRCLFPLAPAAEELIQALTAQLRAGMKG